MHFALMSQLVFTFADFKSLNISMNFLSQLIFLDFFHMFLFFLSFNLLVKESFSFHFFLLSLISFVLFSKCFLLGLMLRMMLYAIEVLLEFVITSNTSSDNTFCWTNGVVHFFLD